MKVKSTLRQAQFILCACLLSLNIFAQQNFDTVVDYNYSSEFPYSIYQVQDSGYIFITRGNDSIEFNKLNKDGSLAFQKIFGFQDRQLYVGMSNSLKPTFDGGWIFGGGLINPLSTTNTNDGLLVKFNANGDTEFVKFVGDTSWETAYDCIQTSDSGFVIVGDKNKYSPNFESDYWIVKTDANGNIQWERTIGTNKDEQAFAVIENNQHQIIVSGAKEYAYPIHYPYIVIYDLQGNLISTKSFNSGALICAAGEIRHYNSDEYLLVGCLDTTINMGDYQYPLYLARLDINYNFKWMTIYNAPEIKIIFIYKEVSDGGIVMVGNKTGNTVYPVGWIAKVDSSGNKLWEHYYAHNNNTNIYNYFSDFEETFDHGFIICGSTYGPNSQDSWIVKLDSNGCLDSSCGLNTGTIELFYSPIALELFPNPATEKVSIKYSLPQGKVGKLTIFNVLGMRMEDQILTEGSDQIEINIQPWAKGIYTCVIETGEIVVTGKILKE